MAREVGGYGYNTPKFRTLLFELLDSHSKLSQAEYNRNPSYNDTHFSYIAEHNILEYLKEIGEFDSLMRYLTERNGG